MTNKNNQLIFFGLFAFVLLTYITGLFVHQTGDAGKYAAVSRTIFETGDWINLQSRNQPYDQKPPLLFWLSAISFHLFGVSNWAFKIPTLLFSVLGIYSIFRLGKLLYSSDTGRLAALVYATSEMCFLYNMDVHTDSLLASATIFGIWQIVEFLHNKKWYHFLLGFTGVGLAMLSKGPIGLAVPVFAIGSHLLLHRKFKTIFHPQWLAGAVLLALLISPALLGLYNQFGWEGIQFYFWTNMAGRIDGTYAGGNTDYFFYLHTMAYILLPWSVFALLALFMEFWAHFLKKWKILPTDEFVTLGGSVLFLLVLSMAKGKAPHYMMIVTPLLSILTAKWMIQLYKTDHYPRLRTIISRIHSAALLIIWALALLILTYIWPTQKLFIWLPIGIAAFAFTWFFIQKRNLTKLQYLSVLAGTALNFVLFALMLPSMFDYMASVQVCKTYNQEAAANDVLYGYQNENDEIYFYSKGESRHIVDDKQLQEIVKKSNSWIYTTPEGYEKIAGLASLEKIYSYDHKKVSKPKFKFIWPATRQQSLNTRYLIKIAPNSQKPIQKVHFSRGNRDRTELQ